MPAVISNGGLFSIRVPQPLIPVLVAPGVKMEGTPKAERDGHERQTQIKPNVQCILLVHFLSFGPFYNVCAHESLQALLAKSVNDWIRPRIFVPRTVLQSERYSISELCGNLLHMWDGFAAYRGEESEEAYRDEGSGQKE